MAPKQHRNRLQEDLKADIDAVNLEVRSAMYFEVCKRSIEAMIVVNLQTMPHSLVDIYILYIYMHII